MAKRKKANVPMIARNREGKHSSMGADPSQVEAANAYAKKITEKNGMGGITPFRPDGQCVATRIDFTRYINAINKNRPDGQPRLVNFDGGYGDPT